MARGRGVRNLLFVIAICMSAVGAADDVSETDLGYEVAGIGVFNYKLQVDFSKMSTLPPDLQIDTGTIAAGQSPYSRTFLKSNIRFNAGESISLLVPGQERFVDDIPSAEIATKYNDILYGSVRTVAKASTASGTCHGMFFYRDDSQETDIELLTRNLSRTWFTNQATDGSFRETSTSVDSPDDITDEFHEYRIDWLKNQTLFYIDGELKATLTKNVPFLPGAWLWNNWANGGPWTGSPPTETSDFRIQSIEGYFNRTSIKYQPKPANAASSSSSIDQASKTATLARQSTSLLPQPVSTKKPSSLRTTTKTVLKTTTISKKSAKTTAKRTTKTTQRRKKTTVKQVAKKTSAPR